MMEREITEIFIKRKIRKNFRIGNLLMLKNNIRDLGFFTKKDFSPNEYLNIHDSLVNVKIYEPFMLLRIKVSIKKDEIVIGFEFLQNDNIGWIICAVDPIKSEVNSSLKNFRKIKKWKI